MRIAIAEIYPNVKAIANWFFSRTAPCLRLFELIPSSLLAGGRLLTYYSPLRLSLVLSLRVVGVFRLMSSGQLCIV